MYVGPPVDEQDAVWRRLLLREGEEEEEEEEESGDEEERRKVVNEDTGDAAVRGLRALGYPYVGKVKGGLGNIVDYVVLTRGGAALTPSTAVRSKTALVEHHDGMAWEKWRRRQWQATRLPPFLYTTTGLQRYVVWIGGGFWFSLCVIAFIFVCLLSFLYPPHPPTYPHTQTIGGTVSHARRRRALLAQRYVYPPNQSTQCLHPPTHPLTQGRRVCPCPVVA